MTLSDEMKEMAIGYGLCQQWTNEWKDGSTKADLADKFINGIDFCMKHNLPDVHTIRKYFICEEWKAKGIYCDACVIAEDFRFLALLGDCKAKVRASEHGAEIYLRHTSKAEIHAELGAKIWVNTLDYAEVTIYTDKFSKVFVHNYGDCKIEKHGNVSEIDKPGFFGVERYKC